MNLTIYFLLKRLRDKKNIAVWVCTVILFGLNGCTLHAQNTGASAEEKVITNFDRFPTIATLDLNAIGSLGMKSEYFWLDNDRLIMSHTLRGKSDTSSASFLPEKNTIVVWNILTQRVTTHMQGQVRCVDGTTSYVQIHSPAPGEDFNKGFPRHYLQGYWKGDTPELSSYSYPWEKGKEKEGGAINPFSCRFSYTKDKQNDPKGFELYEGHGWLIREYTNKLLSDVKITVHMITREGKDIPIEMSSNDLGMLQTQYLPWKKEYLLRGTVITIPNYLDPPPKPIVRLLKLNGVVELVPVPAFMWEQIRSIGLSASIKPGASRLGMLWRFESSSKQVHMNGIYLQEGHLFTHFVHTNSDGIVSPNGCRIATKFQNEIKVLELCKGELQ